MTLGMLPQMLSANPVKAKAGDKITFTLTPMKMPAEGIKLKKLIGINFENPISIWVDGVLFAENPPGNNCQYLLTTRKTAILRKEIKIEVTAAQDGMCNVAVRGESQ